VCDVCDKSERLRHVSRKSHSCHARPPTSCHTRRSVVVRARRRRHLRPRGSP
jgi:hypothetical protein